MPLIISSICVLYSCVISIANLSFSLHKFSFDRSPKLKEFLPVLSKNPKAQYDYTIYSQNLLYPLVATRQDKKQVESLLFCPKSRRIHGMEKVEIKKKSWVAWSEDEVKLLKRLFPRGRAREIAERIGRSLTAVKHKAYSMGIKTREWRLWSANEIKLLKKLYPSENTQSIADKLGRSRISIDHKTCNIGIKKVGTARVWSRQEEALLRKLHPDNSIRDIADQLGRTVQMVAGKAHKLGLRKSPVWSKKELNLLKKLYPSRTAQQIADQIGRTVVATQLRIAKLGLKKRRRKAKT